MLRSATWSQLEPRAKASAENPSTDSGHTPQQIFRGTEHCLIVLLLLLAGRGHDYLATHCIMLELFT